MWCFEIMLLNELSVMTLQLRQELGGHWHILPPVIMVPGQPGICYNQHSRSHSRASHPPFLFPSETSQGQRFPNYHPRPCLGLCNSYFCFLSHQCIWSHTKRTVAITPTQKVNLMMAISDRFLEMRNQPRAQPQSSSHWEAPYKNQV